MIVLVPLLAPVAAAYGIDEIHFAMLFIFVMAVGGVTPPMGTLIFVTCGVTKCDIKAFIKESLSFLCTFTHCHVSDCICSCFVYRSGKFSVLMGKTVYNRCMREKTNMEVF